MSVPTYSRSGVRATSSASLDKAIFGLKPTSHQLLRQAYESYLANGRTNQAQTKTRGLVRGGGRKPWRQKGLGRARVGSIRSPLWRGGGITFGPSGQQNYTKQLPLKARRLALKQALSLAASSNRLIVVEELPANLAKTTDLAKFLTKVQAAGLIVLVTDKKTAELIRVSRNLASLKLVSASYLSPYDILWADQVVITKPALASLKERLSGAKDV